VSDGSWVSIIALLGWLILAGSALASFQLSWGKALRMGLVWITVFAGVFLVFYMVRGG